MIRALVSARGRRSLRHLVPAALTIFLALAVGQPLAAQSLFSTGGLGLVVTPQDGQAAALGGTSLGLMGPELSWDNPAGAVGLPAAGLRVSFQMDDFESTLGDLESSGSTARFPLIMGAFPFGNRWAVTVGFAGFLDQNWAFEQADSIVVASDTVQVIDRISSDGGASRFRLGGGYRISESLSVGLGAELFTGGVNRVAGRIFPGQNAPTCCSASWTYSGTGLLASVDWTPSAALTFALSASAGGSLEAEQDVAEDEQGVDRSYDLPVMVNGGVTGRVASGLLVTLGGRWAGWSSMDGALAEGGGARDSWALRGGIEADGFELFGQPLPLRVGVRREQLPFRFGGLDNDWADETAYSAGTGLILGGAARLDVAVERGDRGSAAAGLDESYWRIHFSASVLGR